MSFLNKLKTFFTFKLDYKPNRTKQNYQKSYRANNITINNITVYPTKK